MEAFIKNDEDYSKHILRSMDQARKELHCEFVGLKGRDVIEEMRKKYVEVLGAISRDIIDLRFGISTRRRMEATSRLAKGKIMIIAPRHLDNGEKPPPDMETTWAQYTRDTGEELDTEDWRPGPVSAARGGLTG
ncbi:hypothetical protein OS493_023135 [Desmophyllum pertusum]|uniref:Uncharacterized protein n=1 Tax=Desmophyllum pertusum TaxID=174260 RepID=A0A9W9YZZ0_9CNID|nr:hypothetical protein OS493_023135 [Desmophyllum pertusum]